MVFSNEFNPYPRSRKSVYAKNGMVATSQVAASQAGLDILKKGGNAIDAAIATAAALTVVEPTSNGIGSDSFAIINFQGKTYGINGSGPAPAGLSKESLNKLGFDKMPTHGWNPVLVPGTPATWAELVERFGNLSLSEDLAPAIHYAKSGFAVSQVLSYYWNRALKGFEKSAQKDSSFAISFEEWRRIFTEKGKTPKPGDIWFNPDQAKTLTEIGSTNAESFYRGNLARKISEASAKAGGFLSSSDLANYHPQWVTPLNVSYHGYDVLELPPNGQGIVTLEALGILDSFDFSGRDIFDTTHKQIEALKLGFNDLFTYIGDPVYMQKDPQQLLSAEHLAELRNKMTDFAQPPVPEASNKGGTVYLCTADNEGNMVSYIQSNYMGFGSGIVIPGTGLALNNRGNNFSLDEKSPNYLKGGKRPLHTIIPGFLQRDGIPIGPFGVMGGFMQPQGHLQVLMNSIDFGLDPQGALDAPRFQWLEGNKVDFEREFSTSLLSQLRNAGHEVSINPEPNTFGRGQIIWRNPQTGTLIGGSDSRTDGAVSAW
ncbi:gamma-glutamyltransferase family protein [Lactiplantibacillus plantarum]|uniref:gamma-glutamyltransferase family protein n=1 Tax=Lactiplantibacillus plantarum TaxID=1590 RepID=UPI0021CB5221|nr:gamma-glutamyltransferase family protein [Lactiplantibacillus plantarum]